MDMQCKKCNSTKYVKSGTANDKQRYRCKECGCHFTEGDGRTKETATVKKALAVLLYATARTSFRRIGKILGVDHSLVYRWIRDVAESLPEPVVSSEITEVELDEMWHFIKDKKTANSGLSKQLTVVQGEPLHGLQAIVILKQSDCCIENSHT